MNAIRIRETLEEIRYLYNTYLARLEFNCNWQTDKPDKNYESFYDYKKEEEGNRYYEV